jgi:hypothetical protein
LRFSSNFRSITFKISGNFIWCSILYIE